MHKSVQSATTGSGVVLLTTSQRDCAATTDKFPQHINTFKASDSNIKLCPSFKCSCIKHSLPVTYGRNHKPWIVPRFGTPVKGTCEEEKVLKASFIVRLNCAFLSSQSVSGVFCLIKDPRADLSEFVHEPQGFIQPSCSEHLPCPAQLSLC